MLKLIQKQQKTVTRGRRAGNVIVQPFKKNNKPQIFYPNLCINLLTIVEKSKSQNVIPQTLRNQPRPIDDI